MLSDDILQELELRGQSEDLNYDEEFEAEAVDDLFYEAVEDDLFYDVPTEDEVTSVGGDKNCGFDNQPLYPDSHVSVGAFMLLIALFITKHNLVSDAVQQLLNIFAYILPPENKVCSTVYAYKMYFKDLKNPLRYHYFCPHCLGCVADKTSVECSYNFCRKSFRGVKLPYFLEIPVTEQIKSFFLQRGFFSSIQGRFKKVKHVKTYEDIYDGELYTNLFGNNGPLSKPENISFGLNTDGAPVFKSSNVSIWPLMMTINELDLKQRMKSENMLLAGLWFGNQKPAMCTFLKPLVETMKEFGKGIECTSPERGTFTCHAFLISATADLPARALLCNSVQYNGSFGCWKCLQKGETAARGRGHTHIFPFQRNDPKGPLRKTENVLGNAQSVIDSGRVNYSVNGIKGPSWLSFCPKFDLVNGVAIDYMHGVLLGVQKLLLRLWFTKEFASKPFSFFSKLSIVDSRLLKIRPTLDITRIPRSIEKELKYWKASEFQNFLLFYALPVLRDILDRERFLHYALFIQAIFTLLKSGSGKSDLEKADKMLLHFCDKFQTLYDRSFITLNIHQLVHLVDNVRQLGPLYAHSCFPFEDKNGLLLKMIRGTQNIDQQIVTGISFIQKLPELKLSCVEKGSKMDFLCDMIERPNILKRGKQLGEGIYILGGLKTRLLKDDEFQALGVFLSVPQMFNTIQTFNRIELHGNIIYGTEYARMLKRDNSTVRFKSGANKEYGRVRFFLLLNESDGESAVAAVECFDHITSDLQVSHIFPVKPTGTLKLVSIEHIECLCMMVDFQEENVFICEFPNQIPSL